MTTKLLKSLQEKDENIVYGTDASQIEGKTTKVIQPLNILDIKMAVKTNPRLCIRGGGTGLAGGAVPQDEPVLDLSKLNRIENLDVDKRIVEVEAGVILDELNAYLAKYDLEFPVNPSSHAVCTIGGMIATNAVGSRAVKYGKTSEWVNWVEIVNSQGELQKKSKTELSDYSGMEGTTGVIYKANLRLVYKNNLRTAKLFARNYIGEVVEIVRELKRNSDVSMIEFLDKRVSEMVGLPFKYHLLVEFESDIGEFKGREYERIMAVRDHAYPLLAQKGYTRIEDPKIMLDRFDKLFTYIESYDIPVFGHLSVGIIHPCFSKEQEKYIPEIMALTKKLSGQISGEHGIGLLKKEFVDITDKRILSNIKNRTDPTNKFNSGKVV